MISIIANLKFHCARIFDLGFIWKYFNSSFMCLYRLSLNLPLHLQSICPIINYNMLCSMLISFNPRLLEAFLQHVYQREMVTTSFQDFCYKASLSYDFGTTGIGIGLLFPLIPISTSTRHNDVLMTSELRKAGFYGFSLNIAQISHFR